MTRRPFDLVDGSRVRFPPIRVITEFNLGAYAEHLVGCHLDPVHRRAGTVVDLRGSTLRPATTLRVEDVAPDWGSTLGAALRTGATSPPSTVPGDAVG